MQRADWLRCRSHAPSPGATGELPLPVPCRLRGEEKKEERYNPNGKKPTPYTSNACWEAKRKKRKGKGKGKSVSDALQWFPPRHITSWVPGLQFHLHSNLLGILRHILLLFVHICSHVSLYSEYSFPLPPTLHLTNSHSSFWTAHLEALSPVRTDLQSILKFRYNVSYPLWTELDC